MTAALLPFALILLASWAGMRLSTRLAWTAPSSLVAATGLAVAPFLLGIAGIISMAVLPKQSAALHVAVTCLLLLALSLGVGARAALAAPVTLRGRDMFALAILATGIMALWFAAITTPREINDAVEYALVVRDLLTTHDLLGSYPRLDSSTAPSGFYFAWTHPPTFVVLQYLFASADPQGAIGIGVRLVDPWIATVTVGITMAMTDRLRPSLAPVAGLLLIGTPLYFLGAAGGLIDPLPVLAGALAVVGAAAFAPTSWVSAGLLIGVGLWSHSVAVLLLPIAVVAWCVHVPRELRARLGRIPGLVATALAVGVAPFVWNLHRSGNLVSDTPAVVRMAEAEWESFYDFTRGVSTPAAELQYGVLKGLFAPEAYGIVFALAALSVLLAARARRSRPSAERMELLGLAVWPVCFVLGSAATVLLGTNVLIRNERLLLSVLAPSAVLGAYALARLGGWIRSRMLSSEGSRRVLHSAALLALLAPIAVLTRFALQTSRQATVPPVVAWIDSNVAPGARVLSFKPGDFVYSRTRVMTHIDAALLPVYRASSPAEAASQLKRLGVEWIHFVEPTAPSFTGTMLEPLLADPTLTALVWSGASNQLYHLTTADSSAFVDPIGVPIPAAFSTWRVVNLGGRKELGTLPFGEASRMDPERSVEVSLPLGLFDRHVSTFVVTGRARRVDDLSDATGLIPVTGDELALSLVLRGRGLVKAHLAFFNATRDPVASADGRRPVYLGDVVLDGSGTPVHLVRRVLVPPGARQARLALQAYGTSSLQIDSLSVVILR